MAEVRRWCVGQQQNAKGVCLIWGREAPNGFQQKINCSQKSLVSIKSPFVIKASAVGNRYKLHLSPCPGGPSLIKRMGFPLCGFV